MPSRTLNVNYNGPLIQADKPLSGSVVYTTGTFSESMLWTDRPDWKPTFTPAASASGRNVLTIDFIPDASTMYVWLYSVSYTGSQDYGPLFLNEGSVNWQTGLGDGVAVVLSGMTPGKSNILTIPVGGPALASDMEVFMMQLDLVPNGVKNA